MKTGIILLARMGSTRLPGKVMLDLCGKPMLEHIINRLSNLRKASPLVVATTINPKDNIIAEFCRSNNVHVFRGSEDNVLERCIQAAEAYGLDAIVRVGADTPFIDWEIIDDMLEVFFAEYHKGNRLEYLSNNIWRSFPLGLDADIMTKNSLLRIDAETKNSPEDQRKLNEINVVPYIHTHLDKFNTLSYHKDFDYSYLRWTLDTREDYELTKKIYETLYPTKPDFLMKDILELLDQNPTWSSINAKVVPRSGHWTEIEKKKLEQRFSGTTPASIQD